MMTHAVSHDGLDGTEVAADIADPLLAVLLPVAIESLIAAGDIDGAENLTAGLVARSRQSSHPWARAAAARCGALVLAARGELDAAEDLVRSSVAELRGVAVPFELARTLLVHGQVLRRRRAKQTARDALDEALALFEALGADRWAERTRTQRERLGVRRVDASLTVTEEHVARLVASGMSNKQIAREMFVSLSTVKSHLSNTYFKLNVRGRTQLASVVASGGLRRAVGAPPAA